MSYKARATRRQGEKNVIGHGLNRFARTALALASFVIIASCGSGGVGVPPVNDPNKITILPLDATLYSGLPTTFSITGGSGAYIVSSSNQAIVPVAQTLVGSTLTVIPNPVVADTTLTLTARDTGTTTPATVTLTVRPGTVSNIITITPSAADCAPAICSGGDAVVSTLISQGGIPLAARGVRFDVVQGDYRFITSAPGQSETTALTFTTATDETGTARARIRVLNAAPNQAGIIQITDLGSGAYQRTTVLIAQASATVSGFFVVPDAITFTGARAGVCANNISAQVFVFGGSPPYTVSNPSGSAYNISPTVLPSSGSSFTIAPSGLCTSALPIAVRDSAGRLLTVTVSNVAGTTPVTAVTVSPTAVTLNSCTASAGFFVNGGTGSYSVASSNSGVVMASISGNLVTVRRVVPSDATGATGITIGVTDGSSLVTVPVTLAGTATTTCP